MSAAEAIRRPSTWDDRAALKLATKTSLTDAGPVSDLVAEKYVRVGEAALSRAARHSIENADNFVAIDVALDLDLLAGEPRHARALAERQGWKLVPMATGAVGAVCLKVVAGLFAACAPAKLALMAAMEDGRIDPTEAADCDAKLRELEREIGDMRARLRRVLQEGER